MDRREFLITSGGAAVAATSGAALAADAVAAPSIVTGRETRLRLALAWPDTPHGPADRIRRIAQSFATLADGRYDIEVVPASNDADVAADFFAGPAHSSDAHPAAAYFGGLPGSVGLSGQDLAAWIAIGGGQMLWDDLARERGWKPLLAGHTGDAPPLWSRHPVASLQDLAGLRIAAPGLGADVARALGAEAMRSMDVYEGAAALSAGQADAAEFGDLSLSLAVGAPKLAGHAVGTGLNRNGVAFACNVKLETWERFSAAERAMLEAAASEEYQASLAEARVHAGMARRMLATQMNVAFSPWPTDVADALDRVAEATVAHVAGHDARAARIDQSYIAFRAMLADTGAGSRTADVS